MFTMLCYALSNVAIILCDNDTEIDFVSAPYTTVFAVLGALAFVALTTVYFATKKGVTINNEYIEICVGYPEKHHSIKTRIDLTEITSLEKSECVNYREEKRCCFLISYGIIIKNSPVLKITTGGDRPKMHLVQCENIDGLIKEYAASR